MEKNEYGTCSVNFTEVSCLIFRTFTSFSNGCHGNATLSLVWGSVTDDFPDGIAYHKTKPCMYMLHTTEVMAIIVIFYLFWPKFGCHGNVP